MVSRSSFQKPLEQGRNAWKSGGSWFPCFGWVIDYKLNKRGRFSQINCFQSAQIKFSKIATLPIFNLELNLTQS